MGTQYKEAILTLTNAKLMYNSGNEPLVQFALSNFTKEELEAEDKVKSWKQLKTINGYYIGDQGRIHTYYSTPPRYPFNANTFPTESLAKASLALSQLLQLRDNWRDGYDPYYGKNLGENKYGIIFSHNSKEFHIDNVYGRNSIFVFKTKEETNQFLETFKELLWEARELI